MNLLDEPVFKVITPAGQAEMSLPELLSALGEDQIDTILGLQRHQEDIFHIFLCYLAGAVMVRLGVTEPAQKPETWKQGLRQLAGRDDDCSWELLVEDKCKPAFMQPPSPNQEVFETDFRKEVATPDALDVLQTAKNHDIKIARATQADLADWVFALISSQTASGFLGRGNYGIARMNGGFGSRVCVSWQDDRRVGKRFVRDVSFLNDFRPKLLQEPYPYRNDGLALLWQKKWDGGDSLSLPDLDPFFIEIARRVRLVSDGPAIKAVLANSSCPRIAAQQMLGNVGDPWIPIKADSSSALTPSTAGLTPKLLRDVLFQDNYIPAPLQIPTKASGSGWFCASVLIRGKGTTDGFHEAAIRVPERARPLFFGQGAEYDRLAVLSKKGLDLASALQNRVLKPALFSVMEGGPDRVKLEKREVAAWVDSIVKMFHQGWRYRYFEWLWSTMDTEEENEGLKAWFLDLRKIAEETLENAIKRAPSRAGRGYRAITRARGFFYGAMYKHFTDYMEGKS